MAALRRGLGGIPALEPCLPVPAHNLLAFCAVLVLSGWALLLLYRFRQTLALRRTLRRGQVARINGLAPYAHVFSRMCRNHLNALIRTRQASPPKRVATVIPLVDLDLANVKIIPHSKVSEGPPDGLECRFDFHAQQPCTAQVIWDCSFDYLRRHHLSRNVRQASSTASWNSRGVRFSDDEAPMLAPTVVRGGSAIVHRESSIHSFGRVSSTQLPQVDTQPPNPNRLNGSLQTLLPIRWFGSQSSNTSAQAAAHRMMAASRRTADLNQVSTSIEDDGTQIHPQSAPNQNTILPICDYASLTSWHVFDAGLQSFQTLQEEKYFNAAPSLSRWKYQSTGGNNGRCSLVICFRPQALTGIEEQIYVFEVSPSTVEESPKTSPRKRTDPTTLKLTPKILHQLCKLPSGQANNSGGSDWFSIQEIFGLDDPSSPECVVCLTDPKDIAFLPCRHLCVCKECSKHVDRCPVCRTPFENYVGFDRSKLQNC